MSGKKNIAGLAMRKLRRQSGWTQKELAMMLRGMGWKKCTREKLARIEAGEATIRDVHLTFIHAVLGDEFCAEFRTLVAKECVKGRKGDE